MIRSTDSCYGLTKAFFSKFFIFLTILNLSGLFQTFQLLITYNMFLEKKRPFSFLFGRGSFLFLLGSNLLWKDKMHCLGSLKKNDKKLLPTSDGRLSWTGPSLRDYAILYTITLINKIRSISRVQRNLIFDAPLHQDKYPTVISSEVHRITCCSMYIWTNYLLLSALFAFSRWWVSILGYLSSLEERCNMMNRRIPTDVEKMCCFIDPTSIVVSPLQKQ